MRKGVTQFLAIMLLTLAFAGCQAENNRNPKDPITPEVTSSIDPQKQPELPDKVPTEPLPEPTKETEKIPTKPLPEPTKETEVSPTKPLPEPTSETEVSPTKPLPEPTKGTEEGDPSSQTETGMPVEDENVRNLNGFQLVIGNWTGEEEDFLAVQEKLHEIMKKYNFSVVEKKVSDRYNIGAQFALEVKEGSPSAHVYEISEVTWISPFVGSQCYDMASRKEIDLSDPKWNTNVISLMTRGEKVYGLNIGPATPSIGIIFNRRLFEEAGIDPELPYDLQKSGEWTWSKFEELCKKLTRDVNNDGRTDMYALSSETSVMLNALMASNQTQLFIKEDDFFKDNSLSSECKEAAGFAARLYKKGYVRPQEVAAENHWDYFQRHFRHERVAMQFSYEYAIDSTYANMKDRIGFVMVPKPDEASDYYAVSEESCYVIPACYDEKTVSDIAFAFDKYMAVKYEVEMENYLAPYYDHLCDNRAVEETIPMMMDQKRLIPQNEYVIDGISTYRLYLHYPFTDVTWEKGV